MRRRRINSEWLSSNKKCMPIIIKNMTPPHRIQKKRHLTCHFSFTDSNIHNEHKNTHCCLCTLKFDYLTWNLGSNTTYFSQRMWWNAHTPVSRCLCVSMIDSVHKWIEFWKSHEVNIFHVCVNIKSVCNSWNSTNSFKKLCNFRSPQKNILKHYKLIKTVFIRFPLVIQKRFSPKFMALILSKSVKPFLKVNF